jgi:hypothetical protein
MLRLLLLLSAAAPSHAFCSLAFPQKRILYAWRSHSADKAHPASLAQAASAAAGIDDVVALPVVSEDDDSRTETSSEAADATEAALLTAVQAPPAPLTLADWMQLADHKFALAMAPGFFGFYAQVSFLTYALTLASFFYDA